MGSQVSEDWNVAMLVEIGGRGNRKIHTAGGPPLRRERVRATSRSQARFALARALSGA